jgi:hypothetical protein
MARPLLRLFSQRIVSPSSNLFPQLSSSCRPVSKVASKTPFYGRRGYATGESGPNPRPGQSTIRVWPFVAITLAGTGAYIMMVKSRAGMSILLSLFCFNGLGLSESSCHFESRFKELNYESNFPVLRNFMSSSQLLTSLHFATPRI